MIDYLANYGTEENAPARPEDVEPWVPSWEIDGRTYMPVSVFKELTPGDDSDPENPVPAVVEYAPGYWVAIVTAEPDDDLWNTAPVVHEVVRETGEVLRTRLTPEQIAYGWHVSPVFAGSDYAFGAPTND